MTVRLNPAHGGWLRALLTEYDMLWATTWEADANAKIGRRLGLPPLPHITFAPPPPGYEGWTPKLHDIVPYVEDRPVAWVDDRFEPAALDWADERTHAGIPTLLVETDGRIGLTEAHVQQLREFAARVRE